MAKRKPRDETDVFDADRSIEPRTGKEPPAYRIYEGSRIAVGKGVGKMWKMRLDAALRAYEVTHNVWTEVFKYYNHDHTKTLQTSRGLFQRGDSSENIVFSNTNVLLNAVYTKNPEITCTTIDKADEPICETLQALLNVLFRKRDKLNAKPRIRRMAGFAALTDFGVVKLEFTKKEQSREFVAQEMQKISQELAKETDPAKVEEIYGKLHALEQQLQVSDPSGPRLSNILSHNLIVDPAAEQPDGCDANWMIERVFLPTEGLKKQFTQPGKDGESDVLVYKPTHQAEFTQGSGEDRDAGLGLVLTALGGDANMPMEHRPEEQLAYLYRYYTECYYVWDKATRRVYLFHRDDWKWPIWVWDDPFSLSRFFPYFILCYSFLTGGIVGSGEIARYLDQQDEINDINRQVSRIRRSIFDYFFFNSDMTNEDEVTKMIDAIRGKTKEGKHVVGVRAGEGKITDMIQAFLPPAANYEAFFNKQPAMESINRISSVNEGLRGVQFKANTTEDAVNTYQDAIRMAIGAKTDAIEDVVADVAHSLAEMAVQYYDQETVAGLIGDRYASKWMNMSVQEFNANYSVEIVAGSMEKPNSVFKKKEAVQIAQAVGQFAQAAPGATLRIMLRVLEQAFSEVVIKRDDWDKLDQEVQATLTKGVSTEGSAQQQGQPQQPAQQGQSTQPQQSGQQPQQLMQLLQAAPPEFKQKIVQAKQAGASDQEIMQLVQQFLQQQGSGANAMLNGGNAITSAIGDVIAQFAKGMLNVN